MIFSHSALREECLLLQAVRTVMHHDTTLNFIFYPMPFSQSVNRIDLLASIWTQNSGYTVKLFSIVPLSELLLRVETTWQMWNETIILTQIVLPWGFGFYLFTSCTSYHLNQPPEDYYYVLLIFWVLNLKKCWKLIASVRIKEDFCLEQIKCCVIKKSSELSGNNAWQP